jgi:hypothetical protein
MTWILQTLEDLDQSFRLGITADQVDDLFPLRNFYITEVQQRVFNLEWDHCPDQLRERYERIYSLDSDKELFDLLLMETDQGGSFPITVGDIGNLKQRDASKLISFTTNLNPALREILRLLASVPMSEEAKLKLAARTEADNKRIQLGADVKLQRAFQNRHNWVSAEQLLSLDLSGQQSDAQKSSFFLRQRGERRHQEPRR